jgi:hypothetical protein
VTGSSACSRPSGEKEREALNRRTTDSEQQWLRVRSYFREHRYELAVWAARDYPESAAVEGTPLLSTPLWLPDAPIVLDDIELQYTPDTAGGGITCAEPVIKRLLPVKADGVRYRTYSDAVSALPAPGIFENRCTYLYGAKTRHSCGDLVFC